MQNANPILLCNGQYDCKDMTDEDEHCIGIIAIFILINQLIKRKFYSLCKGFNYFIPFINFTEDCPTGNFKCHKSDSCIMVDKRCDGYNDCLGGEDENNCSK